MNAIRIQPFDAEMLGREQGVLLQLAQLYCDTFSLDPNFGEYRQCPNCKRYYNYEQVEQQGITACSNDGKHVTVALVPAWEPESVKKEILGQAGEENFHGVLALAGMSVVGFAWARVITFSEVRAHWGDQVVNQLQPLLESDVVVYFDELGVSQDWRSRGIGKSLVVGVSSWAKINFSGKMSLLRTHERSHARLIFERVGYEFFANDTEYGSGRVMMKIGKCGSLRVER